MSKFWLFFIFVYIFDIAAMISAKLYSSSQNLWYLLGCVGGFALTGLFFGLALNYKGVAIANMLWVGIAAILMTFIGYFIFKEQISTIQFLGLGFVFIGLILVNSQ